MTNPVLSSLKDKLSSLITKPWQIGPTEDHRVSASCEEASPTALEQHSWLTMWLLNTVMMLKWCMAISCELSLRNGFSKGRSLKDFPDRSAIKTSPQCQFLTSTPYMHVQLAYLQLKISAKEGISLQDLLTNPEECTHTKKTQVL